MSDAQRLTIVALGGGGVPVETAQRLAGWLRDHLGIQARVDKRSFRHAQQAEDGGREAGSGGWRGQPEDLRPVSSNALVDQLVESYSDSGLEWILGLTAHDLEAPGRSYVFGEATLNGRWAVVSIARLGPADCQSPRLVERLRKEVLHELGHLAGLDHCTSSDGCAMSIAFSVAAIDARSSEFCLRCASAFPRKRG